MADLGKLHQELVQVRLVGRALAEVLGEITSIARRSMPGADAVSITLIRGDEPYTAAHDGQMALDADELQYQRGYGPCIDAARSSEVFLIDDMASEQRWPDYARHAAAHGAGSSLSVPLPFQAATIGGLNNYATRLHAFGADDVAVGVEVASWVAFAVANATAAASAADDTAHMWAAMATRAEIEQAKGILIERHKITADQAFAMLSKASQRTGAKLRTVAADLVRSGTLPGTADQATCSIPHDGRLAVMASEGWEPSGRISAHQRRDPHRHVRCGSWRICHPSVIRNVVHVLAPT